MQDPQYWVPHPDLELVPVLQRYVNSIPIDEQQPLLANEEHAIPKAAFNRVQNAAFCQGFLVVKGSGSEKIGRIRINCVHSRKQRNTRRIEEGEWRRVTKVRANAMGLAMLILELCMPYQLETLKKYM